MPDIKRSTWIWLVGNMTAVALWLWVASGIWPPPGWEHCDFAPGDPWYFFLLVAPILLVAALGNPDSIIICRFTK